MLAITCEYLTGVVVATDVADRNRVEWPPHPGRLFSALAAAYGDGGSMPDERAVLAWLETLGPPDVHAPEVRDRTVGDHYVPVNDTSMGSRKGVSNDALGLLPAHRVRQARTFPTAVLSDERCHVHFVWPDAVADDTALTTLQAIAARVSYLGHSRSLVRLHAHQRYEASPALHVWRVAPQGTTMLRVAAEGRLHELEVLHASGQRPTMGAMARYARHVQHKAVLQGSLGGPWIPLRFAGHFVPALEAWPQVAWGMRRALIRCVDTTLGGELSAEERHQVLSAISGHAPDGTPMQQAHVAYVPLAHVGFGRHSSGLLLGAAMVLPTDSDPIVADALRAAISRAMVATPDADTLDGLAFSLHLGETGMVQLAFAYDDTRRSLSPRRYTATGTRWTTVTPVVLDRFPRASDDIPAIVADACRHAGLPRPTRVETHKQAACAGAPPVRPRTVGAGKPGAWRTAWRDDTGKVVERFGNRLLTHVTLTFDTAVRGPVLLGAGRYSGLGLCLPIGEVAS